MSKEKIDPKAEAAKIHSALKGGDLNERQAIHILAALDPHTLEKVKTAYGEDYGNSLILDISKHVDGHFGQALVALLKDPDELDAEYLYKAMKGLGTNDTVLIEILVTRTPEHLKKIAAAFLKKYNESLDKWLIEETSGDYRKYLRALADSDRDPASKPVDKDKVAEDSLALYKAGEGRLGTNEEVFIEIFASRSWKHLRQVAEHYGKNQKHSLETAIEKEFSGDLKRALLWTLDSVVNRHAFFARRLFKAMDGLGTKDDDLVRIMVTRRHNDLWEIAEEYHTIYKKTLQEDISGDTSGDYKKLLLQLVKES
jgi:annexin A7/11